jgi:hypothetical protein
MKNSIAGMSLGGGRKENFFFALLEYFDDQKRWFLTTIKQVKDEEKLDSDETITNWITNYKLKELVVDFPLTKPHCLGCDLSCPGTKLCHHPSVKAIRSEMQAHLEKDQNIMNSNPKKYEQERVEENKVNYNRNVMESETTHHILSKSFKRKLKKGYLPYWNRPIDYWVWKNYYDQILNTFNISYDSFGNVSVMLMHRFEYLLKHLPQNLEMYESNYHIALLELLRAKIISKKSILELSDLDLAPLARLQIAKHIDEKLGVFVYEKDLELIAKNPKAFDSFILAIAGMAVKNGTKRRIDLLSPQDDDPRFIAPIF